MEYLESVAQRYVRQLYCLVIEQLEMWESRISKVCLHFRRQGPILIQNPLMIQKSSSFNSHQPPLVTVAARG